MVHEYQRKTEGRNRHDILWHFAFHILKYRPEKNISHAASYIWPCKSAATINV